MTLHTHRTPLPAAVPPVARGLPGSVTRALARLSRTVALPKPSVPDRNARTIADAIRTMRAADPALDLRPDLIALRRALADRIEADLTALNLLDGDPDLDADYATNEAFPHGGLFVLGRSSDDEAPENEGCESELETDMEPDREPSLGSLGGTAPGLSMAQCSWCGGGDNDRERDDADVCARAAVNARGEALVCAGCRSDGHQPASMVGGRWDVIDRRGRLVEHLSEGRAASDRYFDVR